MPYSDIRIMIPLCPHRHRYVTHCYGINSVPPSLPPSLATHTQQYSISVTYWCYSYAIIFVSLQQQLLKNNPFKIYFKIF